MRYENEPCTACGQAMQPETEDIVVCPECGAPLHRHCWQETGACPNAAQHGGEFAWTATVQPPAPEPEQDGERPGSICPTCGENCPPDALRCDNCGTDFEEFTNALRLRFEQEQLRREQYMRENFPVYTVHGRSVTMGDTLAGQPVEEIALQLRGPQRSVSRYLERFEKSGRVGWNWAAFFFGPYWFFFRKLYRPALLIAAALLALALGSSAVRGAFWDRTVICADKLDAAESKDAFAAALDEYSADIVKFAYTNRWQIVAYAGLFLALRVASALLADPLLRRKLWRNIETSREEGATADGPGQRFGRHQLLIRLGGFSLITPVLCYWALRLLPDLLVKALTWITK